MSLTNFTILIFLCRIFFQVQSQTLMNSTLVSSESFKNTLFKKFRLSSNLSDFGDFSDKNAVKCILHMQEIVNQFPNLNVAPFLDSWGKFPSGILKGHMTDLGNYDQCIETSIKFNDSVANGQYCFASFGISSLNLFSNNDISLLRANPLENRISMKDLLTIKLGICVPDSCSAKLVTQIFQTVTANVLNGTVSGISVSSCSVNKKPDLKPLDVFAIIVFSAIGMLMVLSTIYDCVFMYWYKEKDPKPLFLAFSVISNGRQLFMINTNSSPNTISCLNGIRVFSMVWVLYCHGYMFFSLINLTNVVDKLKWYKQASSKPVLMGTVSVDSFFFLSGLLIAWLALRELDKSNGKINIVMMWVHRYIRLTPALAALILFYMTINKRIGTGPFREATILLHKSCDTNWWSTLLYVQNYATSNEICVAQSWYLAIDTQLYFLSPLILIPLWRWGKKFIPAIVVLSVLSIVCVIATFVVEGYTSLIGFTEKKWGQKIYYPTHTRYSVWLFGIGFGFFMHINRQKAIRPSKIIQIMGWTLSFGTMIAIIFGPYFRMKSDQSASVAEAAAYESLKRISWSIALSWIVFACHFGFGGLVNSILSHPFWQPLGRLNYCMYLVHFAVQSIFYGTIRTDVHFSDFQAMNNFWIAFGISVLMSIMLSLSFEAPVLVIEKVLLKKEKKNLSVVKPPDGVFPTKEV